MKTLLCFLLIVSFFAPRLDAAPFRLGIVGLEHGHVDGFLAEALSRSDIEVVGVVEPKAALAADYAERLTIPTELLFSDLDEMLVNAKPEGVAVFTSTFAHKDVVEVCAKRRVDVMMEKPLAVSMEHARVMRDAVERDPIRVLVNYETTWYPSHELARALTLDQRAVGDIRKIVVRDGHQGPQEIGCPESFLSWLTDPKLNGGGALMDFGCYGANLATWLLEGKRPRAVSAITHQWKPSIYPNVDDDATILVSYSDADVVIQASWNWPFGRKDMDIYGVKGAIEVIDRTTLRLRDSHGRTRSLDPAPLKPNYSEPLGYFAAVVRGEIPEHPLSSFETNLVVTEILDAARESARTQRSVSLPAKAPW
ncbi:MAG: Gfo/Idh/MocA family oxidoreductase [Opitutus sp.]|nr:Gfo/Idh/MocA family oxidoreductase [Opitutus sp.]